MKVIVMSGISGSGKSTYAKRVVSETEPSMKFRDGERYGDYAIIVSADDHFINNAGEYQFDASMLAEAHNECFRDFIEALQSEVGLVIVDNTNCSSEEIAPYMLGASAYGYEAEIVTIRCDGRIASKHS